MSAECPALMIAAAASGQGKTLWTAALAAYHKKRGRRVRIFKTGPDFLDPMVLEAVSGHPVYQLDLWMGSEAGCRAALHRAAQEADLILVEGAMGLFDGHPSSADVAVALGLPVAVVLDAAGMAQTFAAVGSGLAGFRKDVRVAGLFANRVGSERHRMMLCEQLPADLPLLGWLPQAADFELPRRHLGLVQAGQIQNLAERIGHAADALQLAEELPPAVRFEHAEARGLPPLLQGVKIAVARDAAFSFLYPANLDVLREMGAKLAFYSPLADSALPDADAVYLPGGYPELFMEQLEKNTTMRESLAAHHAANKPIVAECGGMLYLLESLTDGAGATHKMMGLLAGRAALQKRFVNLGRHSIELPEGALRGHTFHYSKTETPLAPLTASVAQHEGGKEEAAYRERRLHASYLHHYFPSNPQAAARLFKP